MDVDRPRRRGLGERVELGAAGPSDGRLLYTNTFEGLLREFHCDTCPISSGDPYPNDPLSNDFVLPTPACAPGTSTVPFLVSPAGDYLYRCPAPGWHDASGALVYQDPSDELLHLGALTQQHVLDLVMGTSTHQHPDRWPPRRQPLCDPSRSRRRLLRSDAPPTTRAVARERDG